MWQAIDNAPIGVNVLIFCPSQTRNIHTMGVGRLWQYVGSGDAKPMWSLNGSRQRAIAMPPTHWMPLPDPPAI